ncbi:MAG: response regulator [Candidatus Nanohalobium sp.]
MKALVTEDSSFMRSILTNILDDLGFDEVKEAENGKKALEKFEGFDPDIILLDIVMDEKGGIETLADIRDQDEETPVVMVSAVGQKDVAEEAMEKGAQDFVEKPFDNDDVKETIKEILDL